MKQVSSTLLNFALISLIGFAVTGDARIFLTLAVAHVAMVALLALLGMAMFGDEEIDVFRTRIAAMVKTFRKPFGTAVVGLIYASVVWLFSAQTYATWLFFVMLLGAVLATVFSCMRSAGWLKAEPA